VLAPHHHHVAAGLAHLQQQFKRLSRARTYFMARFELAAFFRLPWVMAVAFDCN
jgi:hypothetical protein